MEEPSNEHLLREIYRLTRENNELICRVGPDTAMGKALRRYWLPVLQTSGLPSRDFDPFPLEILGDKFVAFRNTDAWLQVDI